jgi:Dynamin central region/Dynamin family
VDKTNVRQGHATGEVISWSKTEQDLDPEDLPRLIEEAQRQMGISNNKSFSRDLLRLQISGPDHSPLTLVDLPGIIESHSKHKDNIGLIKSVVDEWIMQRRSIILVVVDARNDAETQGILTRAREVDPQGERTFGIITKPDLSLPNSKQERYWIRHAQNLSGSSVEFPFKKGWHVLMNRGFEEVAHQTSSTDRDTKERQFFTDPTKNWHEVDPAHWGIDALRRRLSKLLYEHTRAQLPQVQRDIMNKLEQKNAHLDRLEEKTKEPERLWTDYQRSQKSLLRLVTVGVDGKYNDAFFSDLQGSPALHLRSRLEEQYEQFQHEMIDQGSDIPMPSKDGTLPLDISILVDEVRKVMRETRGEELAGHFDPQRLDLLFWKHSADWNSIASRHLDAAHQHCAQFLDQVIHVHLQNQVPGLPKQVLSTIVADLRKSLKGCKTEAKDELQKLERDRRRSTKTLNHTFQRVSQGNRNKKLQRMFNRAHYVEASSPADPNIRRPLMTPEHVSTIAGKGDVASENAETIAEDMLAFLRVSPPSHP